MFNVILADFNESIWPDEIYGFPLNLNPPILWISFKCKPTCIMDIQLLISFKLKGLASYNLEWITIMICWGWLARQRHPQVLDGKFLGLFDTPSIDGNNMEWCRFIVPCFGDEARGSLQKRLIGMSTFYFYSLCIGFLSALAYFSDSWRLLYIVTSTPSALYYPFVA